MRDIIPPRISRAVAVFTESLGEIIPMILKLFALLMAVAVTSSSAIPPIQDQGEDRVRNLVLAGVGYIKNSILKSGPQKLGDPAGVDFGIHVAVAIGITPSVNSRFPLNITNVDNCGTSKMETIIVKTDPEALTAQFRMELPEMRFIGDYQIDGEIARHQKLKGKGDFEIKFINATWKVNNLQLLETEAKALRIKSLGLMMDIGDISVVTKGLTVENTTVPEVEERIRQLMLARFNSSQVYSQGYESVFINSWNKRIENRTLEECIRWLNEKASSSEDR